MLRTYAIVFIYIRNTIVITMYVYYVQYRYRTYRYVGMQRS